MKAPDKIYLATTEEVQNLDTSFVGIAHSDPQDIVEPIEYVRKDAFIEKVYNWLKNYAFVDDNKNVNLPILLHDFLKDSRNF